MVNKKTIITGFFVVFAIMTIALYAEHPTQASESYIPNVKSPPKISLEVAPDFQQEGIQELGLPESDNNVVCDKPPRDNKYGGISGSDNNPPNGTIVTGSENDMITASGTCGKYWYISGWWFNASEMTNLPSDTIMYGISPYVSLEGSGKGVPREESSQSDVGDDPVVPVPEVATLALVTVGIFGFVTWRIRRK